MKMLVCVFLFLCGASAGHALAPSHNVSQEAIEERMVVCISATSAGEVYWAVIHQGWPSAEYFFLRPLAKRGFCGYRTISVPHELYHRCKAVTYECASVPFWTVEGLVYVPILPY